MFTTKTRSNPETKLYHSQRGEDLQSTWNRDAPSFICGMCHRRRIHDSKFGGKDTTPEWWQKQQTSLSIFSHRMIANFWAHGKLAVDLWREKEQIWKTQNLGTRVKSPASRKPSAVCQLDHRINKGHHHSQSMSQREQEGCHWTHRF